MSLELLRGDLLPEIKNALPGPESRRASLRLARHEAPGINTLGPGDEAALVWAAARGANVLDVDGNRFIDLTSGFGAASIGHRHPRVVAAVTCQSRDLLHGLGDVAAHPARIALAESLCALAPVENPRVHFAVSGADAVEVAIKTSILATGRKRLLVFAPGYHGLTLGALAATSRPAFRLPFADQLSPHFVRLPFACAPELVAEALDETFAAVLVEPIVGREGILVPPDGWLAALAALCRARGTQLILDEILTGFGRTGRLFAGDHDGVRPDLLCCGKALGGGLPVAAVVGRSDLMESWRTGGEALHTGTFVAHPLACAAALATLSVLEEERFVERAEAIGTRLLESLSALPESVQLRGRGALWGLAFTRPESARSFATALRARGLLVLCGGPNGAVVELLPPFAITDVQLDFVCEAIVAELASSPP
ncbi:MAG: aspartate aminotransferase family protein [Thermoanaerobaculia bacterium]